MLLMVEKGIGGGIWNAVHKYAKASDKYMKEYDPSTESSYLLFWKVNILYRWEMSQKLDVDGFMWKKKKSKLTQEFLRSYNDDSDKAYFLEVDVS